MCRDRQEKRLSGCTLQLMQCHLRGPWPLLPCSPSPRREAPPAPLAPSLARPGPGPTGQGSTGREHAESCQHRGLGHEKSGPQKHQKAVSRQAEREKEGGPAEGEGAGPRVSVYEPDAPWAPSGQPQAPPGTGPHGPGTQVGGEVHRKKEGTRVVIALGDAVRGAPARAPMDRGRRPLGRRGREPPDLQ